MSAADSVPDLGRGEPLWELVATARDVAALPRPVRFLFCGPSSWLSAAGCSLLFSSVTWPLAFSELC